MLTALELIRKAPVSKDFPPTKICPIIEASESEIFESCALGVDFYEALLEDLVDNTGVSKYNPATSYSVDAKVDYYGAILKSKINTNTTDPCQDTLGTAWEVVPKFQTECVNDIWHTMSLFLAYRITAENTTIWTYNLGAKGTTKYSDDFRQNTTGLVTVDRGERVDFASSVHKQSEKFLDSLLRKIERKYETCEILALSKYVSDLCAKCKPTKVRRISYRN